MASSEFVEPFNRLLEQVATPQATRRTEALGSMAGEPLWGEIEASGFLDALVGDAEGGAGLSLADAGPLLQALGRNAVCAPVGETMIARALLAAAGLDRPSGPIVLATLEGRETPPVPLARLAQHLLVQSGDQLVLAPASAFRLAPSGVHGSLDAQVSWAQAPGGPSFTAEPGALRAAAAVLRATAIAGAADRLLEMTVDYANARVQFGKPIGKLQAIQQQLAVMAEQTIAARIAAQLGCSAGLPPPRAFAAIAKLVTSEAAAEVARIAHATHGAIGVSEEFDLQLYTRRLYEWRLADGSERYWAGLIGAERLADAQQTSVDFVRGLAVSKPKPA